MLGLVVVFSVSWLILWFSFKKHISVLGILPSLQRLKEFFLGLFVMGLFCALNLLGQAFFKGNTFSINPDFGLLQALDGIWWTFKAALFEELVFRGVILFILIKWIGLLRACLIAGIAFGIYHWFSYEMFDKGIIPMLYIFVVTGASGWMFAYAFGKTKSLFAPLGLHFGWIAISIVVFSDGPLGQQFLLSSGQDLELNGWTTLLFFLWQAIVIPGLVTWYFVKNYATTKM